MIETAKNELTQNPASARLARPVLDSDTAEIIRGGNEAKSGTEPKQRMWNVFLDPIRSVTEAQTTRPDKFATASDLESHIRLLR